ncbi:MAG: OmpH family outer membrane protein [Rhodoferax sp.]|jgi:outer membrane protein|uniref:OmpH family outer membrane protein n=1 Tax=Rhodoferax sp. TaxID=50421 RepID=UPI001B6EE855|nr:OmpH family outer membrane protein [Rhodoferax sp.]MBP8286352.1 OmpH family outer membrane protein [Rhodoferax sp.]MBP9735184.1 OmpH family outer membrane protein [Rhodoferax sp.]
MNQFIRQCAVALLGGCLVLSVQAQDQAVKLGFVSTDRVLKEASTAKAAQTKLEQEFSKREKELTELGASVKSMAEKFEKDAPTLPEAQRLSKQKQLVDQDREFQRKRREFQEDLNSRKNEELQLVIQRANKVIKEIAVAEKYDFIFQDAVYVNPKHDMTDKVIKALNSSNGK